MADPHVTFTGALIGGAISIPSIFMGAHVDALIIGLMAAVFVSIWLNTIDSRAKAASAVLFAALVAAYGSPIAAEYVAANNGLANSESLRLLLALALGAGTPTLFPIVLRVAIVWAKKLNGGQI